MPSKFVSLAVRTDFNNPNGCDCYGSIVLKINKSAVINDIIIFNGDVKDIAYKLSKVDKPKEWVKFIH